VRRVAAILLVAAAVASCGQDELSSDVAQRLQSRVAEIRSLAEAGRPLLARQRVQALTGLVGTLVDRGELDRDRAIAIVEAAESVRTNLGLLPPATQTRRPSPSIEEDPGGEGEDKGKGHDKEEKKGDEGHGNGD
jgi:hypothetical protein